MKILLLLLLLGGSKIIFFHGFHYIDFFLFNDVFCFLAQGQLNFC